MARVTATEVRNIIEGCDTDDIVICAYINAANRMITSVYANDSTLSANQLKDIELFLSAHMFVSSYWRMAENEKLGEAQIKYTGKFGLGLDSTPYGQMVKMLDVTGQLNSIGKRKATLLAITSFE